MLTRYLAWLNRNPIWFQGQSFHVVYFGLFAALNTFATASVVMYYLHAKGESFPGTAFCLLAMGMTGNVLGVKLFHLLVAGRQTFGRLSSMLNQTTMYSQGGLVGTTICLLLLAWLQGFDRLVLLDSLACGAAIGLAVGRLGCHNYGCCYGKPTQSRWAVVYTHPQAKVLRLQPQLMGIPLVPTQIYAAAFNCALFGLLMLIVGSLPWDGLAFLVFLLAYNGFRMVIDPWRSRMPGEPPYAKVALGIIALGMLYLGVHAIFAGQILQYRPLDGPLSLAGYITFLGSHWDALVGSLGVGLVAFVFYGVHGKTLGRHVR